MAAGVAHRDQLAAIYLYRISLSDRRKAAPSLGLSFLVLSVFDPKCPYVEPASVLIRRLAQIAHANTGNRVYGTFFA